MSSNSLPADTIEKLNVLDGSSNEFIFSRKLDNTIMFEYKPIQPEDSSSGTYSGGTPIMKNLETIEWTKLMNVFQNAKTNIEHSTKRTLGSLVLKYQSKTIKDSFIISFSSPNNRELANFFHEYRK